MFLCMEVKLEQCKREKYSEELKEKRREKKGMFVRRYIERITKKEKEKCLILETDKGTAA